jgi:hypothetical protein
MTKYKYLAARLLKRSFCRTINISSRWVWECGESWKLLISLLGVTENPSRFIQVLTQH